MRSEAQLGSQLGESKRWQNQMSSIVALIAYSYNSFNLPRLGVKHMRKRGKILRDTRNGPGLLIVEGQQYPFSLEGAWRSDVPPAPGMAVEVEFGSGGEILAIRSIPESQAAKEQAEAALTVAKEQGAKLAAGLVARFGMPSLVGVGLLLISWLFLGAFSIETPFAKLSFTFCDCLGFLNSSHGFEAAMAGARMRPGAGFYGFLALIALAGPFLHHFWKDRRAVLGGLLPLLFVLMVGLLVRSNIQSSLGLDASGPLGTAMKQLRDEAMAAVSLGFGAYLSFLVSFYFAADALRQFLTGKTSKKLKEAARRAAA